MLYSVVDPIRPSGAVRFNLPEDVLKCGATYSGANNPILSPIERKCAMQKKLNDIVLLTSKINTQHVQLAFAILALAMLVLGIGAPTDAGPSPH